MAKVFISHTQADTEFVTRLARDLHDRGLEVWSADQHLEPGDDWAKVIEEAILGVNNVLVVLSKNTANSEWVPAEAAIALSQGGKRIVPIYSTKDTFVPFMLRAIQGLDLSDPQGYPNAIDKLADLLRKEKLPRDPHLLEENSARFFKAQLEVLLLEQERLSLDVVAKSRVRALFISSAAVASMSALAGTLLFFNYAMDYVSIPLAVVFGAFAGMIGVGFVRSPFSKPNRDKEADE